MATETKQLEHITDPSRWSYWSYRLTVTILSLALIVVIFADNIFIVIGPGERGVLWSRFFGGTVLDKTYSEGLQFIFPWDKMYIYDIRVQEVEENLLMLSNNGLVIDIKAAALFHPQPENLAQLHQEIGPDYIEKLIRPKLISGIRQIIGNFEPLKIYAEDEKGILRDIKNIVQSEFEANYVDLDDTMLLHLLLPEKIKESIEQKLVEEQRLQAYEFILQTAEKEKERKTIESQGIAAFEKNSGISILKWKGIEATEAISTSPNTKVVIIGTDEEDLPVILNTGP